MPFTAVLALLGALAPGSAAAAASKTASVANGAVTATINAAGCTLLSVTTEGGELQFRIEQDNVAFEIAPLPPHPDAENVASPPPPSDVLYFSNLTLARLVPSASGTMVTCIFNEHSLPGTGGVIVVPSLVYEAREGWNFISRRATLMPAPPAQHGRSTNTTGVMIKIVTPFSGSIAPALAAAAPAPAASASAAASGTTTRNPPTITPASPVFSQAAGGVFIRSADTGSDDGSKGLMVVVQNNFIRDSSSSSSSPALRAASAVNLAYQADVRHNFATSTSGDHGGKGGDASSVARSAFQADLVLFAPYAERGAAAASVPYSPSGLTAAEYRRFWSAAEAFLLTPPSSRVGTTKMHVPWTANFLEEVDIANPENLEQAKRVITRCSELGIKHILWSARDSAVSNPINATDGWDWGASLWLTVGEHIGAGSWFPSSKGAVLPPTTQALIAFAAQHGVHLCPYIYPSDGMQYTPEGKLAPWVFQGSQRGSCPLPACHMSLPSPKECAQCFNSLASPDFQDFLIDEIGAFVDLAGADGAGFDYTFTNDGESSQYAQWAGWRRILSTVLSTRKSMQVDNRQTNHAWGPWMWVSTGTYAEPIQSDEQPESWQAFTPDLHTARLTANRMRQMNFDYRYGKLCPAATAPGFFSHQSDMTNATGARAWDDNRFIRDFDYFGYQYALLSSVGSAGLNNVVNTLPARDAEEYNSFPAADLAFIKHWLDWTDDNVELLLTAAPLPVAPGPGVVDGTAMTLNNTGYIFLFNPNSAAVDAPELVLDASLGYDCTQHNVQLVVTEVYPVPRNVSVVGCGSKLAVTQRDGKGATVLKVQPLHKLDIDNNPLLLGVAGTVAVDGDSTIAVTGVVGEHGTTSEIQVILPSSMSSSSTHQHRRILVVSGKELIAELYTDRVDGSDGSDGASDGAASNRNVVRATIRHGACSSDVGSDGAGTAVAPPSHFRQSQQVSGSVVGTSFKGTFSVPAAVFAQLAARNKTYPVKWTSNDLTASWLSPGRLLLFVDGPSVTLQAGNPVNVTATINGKAWPVMRSFNCRGRIRNSCYNGPYLDLTAVAPDTQHAIQLDFAGVGGDGRLNITGVFFDNVAPVMTKEVCSRY